ncbi:MAG: glycosyltransferase, partial [Nitrospirota bacterium]|nr:glycosyltransferase [Nitrospirota bacterium]
MPSYLRSVPSVVTVHNAGMGYHQDIADLEFAAAVCGVPLEVVNGCILNNSFDPLLAGSLFGNIVNTVSENYARELQQTGQDWMTGWFGHSLTRHGIKLYGVTNGIDTRDIDPKGINAGFSPAKGEFTGKEKSKRATLEMFSGRELPDITTLHGTISYKKNMPLLTFIGRMDQQKGYDVLTEAIELLFSKDPNVQLLGLGSGDPRIEQRFRQLAAKFNGRICVAIGYSPQLADRIYAAGDFFLIPSHFEPCGLTDFYAQLMGNIPVVHRVGGLVKTLDSEYGFSYLGGAGELCGAIERAIDVYRKPGKTALWKIRKNAALNIFSHFTWDKVLKEKYLPLYQKAIERARPALPYL